MTDPLETRGGAGGFHVGDRVLVNHDVPPPRYAGRVGTVAEVRHVVPRTIAGKLDAERKTREVGVDFCSADALGKKTDAWFLPGELAAVEGVPGRYTAPRSHAKRASGETDRGVAA